jgi:hypothetical protein
MSAPTLTFSPAMFHAAHVAKIKTVTRRHIPGLDAKDIDKFAMSAALQRIVAILHSGMVVDFGPPAHLPGETKPMVTSWRVNGSIDHLKPTEMNPELVMETGGIHWENVGGVDDKGRWNTNRFSHEGKIRPGRFLPKSLYSLAPQVRILSARPEPLLDITEADALLEGIQPIQAPSGETNYGVHLQDTIKHQECTAVEAYHHLWNSLHPDHPADTNPIVWRYEFAPCL